MMHTAYIGMGANLASSAGTPEQTLTAAADRLAELGRLVARSSLYSTEPVGFADQPRFINAAITLETKLSPSDLLAALMDIERAFGRDRSVGIPNGPRTLDLDILLYGDELVREPGLEIPHPRLGDRAFVLVPLAEIASNVVDVTRGASVGQLLQTLLQRSPREIDAVVPLQCEIWRASVSGRDVADARADARISDADRRR